MRPVHRITALVAIGLAATLALSACTKKNEDTPTSSTAAAASAAASSGAPASASGAKIKVAFVPKLQGVPYFEAMNAGGKAAAEEMGNVEWLYQGPDPGRRGSAGRHRPVLHPAEGRHHHRRS